MRDDLASDVRAALSAQIVHHLQSQLLVQANWRRVGLYMPMGSEADIDPLRGFCQATARQAYAPRIEPGTTTLRFVPLDAQTSWRRAKGGFQEPQGQGVHADELDVVLVPGLLFDKRGFRIGYGGGFYDRALLNTSVYAIGVGFAVQMVPQLPVEAHDMGLDALVDEAGLVRCSGHLRQTIASHSDFT